MSERARSFWGWGFVDKLPADDVRAAIAARVAEMLGVEAVAPRPLPRIEDVVLRAPRIAPPASLASFCSNDAQQRITHTYGRSYRDVARGFALDFGPAPDLVAHPSDEAQIAAVLAWASRERVAVIPFGGGTSVVSGVEGDVAPSFRAVVSLDLRALDRVLEIDETSRAARIQGGATGPRIEEQLATRGLTLRHYPQSFEFSTLGGWIATRAGGHFATLYTHIDDVVESVRMLTPAGVFETRRLPASGAGPSPDRLVLGSEGILGVITEAWVRVHQRPRFRASASLHFARFEDAVAATRAVAQAALYPSNCRLLDAQEAELNLVADDGSHVLLLGFESADHAPSQAIDRAVAIAQQHGGRSPRGVQRRDAGEKVAGKDAASSWRTAFLDAPYLQSALVSMGVVVDTFETACTWDRFDALHAAVRAAVGAAIVAVSGTEGRVSCRFSHVYPDGPAPYYTFVCAGPKPGPDALAEQLSRWSAIKRAASEALSAYGATITHHHAVGRMHRPWYDRERPELFASALRAAKRALDPAGVLNPGVLIDP